MTWELLAIGAIVVIMTVVAEVAMRKYKSKPTASLSVDTDELAEKIAKAMGKELREILKDMPRGVGYGRARPGSSDDFEISMDESVIPVNMEVNVEATNLKNATQQQQVKDKGLSASKSKLANLFKKKGE